MSETNASGSSEDPLIGATINGRYRVISLIARGGMGKVFKAEQSALGRMCALKVLSPKYQGDKDPEFERRFFLEAAVASKLNHPNTVTIFDHGKCEAHGLYYIAMEYLDGRTLHQVLHAEGKLPEPRINRIVQQICRSVAEAHSRGVVHRDLKPGNVMLLEREDEADVVKVLDFGLVKDVSGEQKEDLTQTGLFMGSPKYMSPEQITGGEISPRTDVYALGVILYEALCGKVPFDKKASMNTLMAHVHEAAPTMGQTSPEVAVSKLMEDIVMRCLEKEPSRRFGSMRELLNALKRASGDITGSYESLPQITIDPGSFPPADSGRGRKSDPRGATSVPPPSASGGTRASSVMTTMSALDSLTPPPSPPTYTGGFSAQKNPTLRTYAVAIIAALLSVGLTLAVAKRGTGTPSAPTMIVTSVLVPTPMPLPANEGMSNQFRRVRIESEPAGATVSNRGTEICLSTPCEVIWEGPTAKTEHRLNLSKRGFRWALIVVSPQDETVSVKLEPARAPADWQPPATEPAASAQAAPAPAAPVAAAASAAAEPTAVAAVVAPAAVPSAAPTSASAPVVSQVMRFEEGMSRPVMISGREPLYTREAIEAKVQGTVIAKCIITAAGSVNGCRIIKGLPHLDEAVLASLSSRKYQPILYEGRPVSVDYVFTMKVVPPP